MLFCLFVVFVFVVVVFVIHFHIHFLQKWSPSFIVYGDMGRSGGAQSLPALTKEVASGEHVAILHVGDFAYDLDSAGGVVCSLY